jgi:hypothetical protein
MRKEAVFLDRLTMKSAIVADAKEKFRSLQKNNSDSLYGIEVSVVVDPHSPHKQRFTLRMWNEQQIDERIEKIFDCIKIDPKLSFTIDLSTVSVLKN